MVAPETLERLKKIAQNPVVIIAMVFSGALLGFYDKEAGEALDPYGEIFMTMLGMCVLPIMVTAVVAGLGRLLRSPHTRGCFKRMITLYALGLFVPALAGVAAALIGQPGGQIDPIDLDALGEALLNSGDPGQEASGLVAFIGRIIPHNVFNALSQGQILSIVFVCILVGFALGRVKNDKADDLLDLADAIMAVFEHIFKKVMLFLPIGIFCLMAGTMTKIGPSLLTALASFMGVYVAGAVILLILYNAFLRHLVDGSFWRPMKALKEPLLLAAAANSSLIALAPTIEAVQDELQVDPKIAELVVPFGIIANRHGVVYLFAFTTVFLMQIYDITIGSIGYATTLLGTILTGMAAEGQGAAMVPILASLLHELAVPAALAGIVLTTTYCVVGPVTNMLIIFANAILAAYADKDRPKQTGHTRKKAVAAIAALALLPLLFTAAPAMAGKDSPDLDGVLARKSINVAMLRTDIPPMLVTGPDGTPAGFDADLAKEIAQALGAEAVFLRRAQTFDAVVDMVASGEADIGLSNLSVTPERAMKVYFSRPYLHQRYALLINRLELAKENGNSALDPQTTQGSIAVVEGEAGVAVAAKLFPKAKLLVCKTSDERYSAALDGKALAAFTTLFGLKTFLGEKSARALHLKSQLLEKPVDAVAVAVRPDAPRLRYWLDVFLEAKGVELTDADLLIMVMKKADTP